MNKLNLEKYSSLKSAGKTALEIYGVAREDGLGQIEQIRLRRELFGFDLQQAKEITVQFDGYESLDHFQKTVILPAAEAFLRVDEKETELGRTLEAWDIEELLAKK